MVEGLALAEDGDVPAVGPGDGELAFLALIGVVEGEFDPSSVGVAGVEFVDVEAEELVEGLADEVGEPGVGGDAAPGGVDEGDAAGHGAEDASDIGRELGHGVDDRGRGADPDLRCAQVRLGLV